jgi:hypothetical protein
MQIHDVHAERLLGKKIRDVDGVVVGRLEEIVAEVIDGEYAATEFHLGPAAVLERIGAFLGDVPYFSLLPFRFAEYRVKWSDMDLMDASHPKLRVRKADLSKIEV